MATLRHSPKVGPRGKASGRSRWVFASMATPPTPFAAYSNGPGLAEPLRLYVCGLQPRPSVQLSSSRVIANDNEYSPESGAQGQGFRPQPMKGVQAYVHNQVVYIGT
jgi:hypothetical protein